MNFHATYLGETEVPLVAHMPVVLVIQPVHLVVLVCALAENGQKPREIVALLQIVITSVV